MGVFNWNGGQQRLYERGEEQEHRAIEKFCHMDSDTGDSIGPLSRQLVDASVCLWDFP